MSKYIIEIPDGVPYVMLRRAAFGITEIVPVAELEELTIDYIKENCKSLLNEFYQKGYKEGRNVGIKDGMCEAWEAARKIAQQWEEDTDTGHRVVIDDSIRITLDSMTASEAIEKLKAYEEKQKADDKFEFGDEIIDSNGEKGCVVSKGNEEGDTIFALFSGYRTPQCIRRRNYRKTGKHYDIQSILEAMKNG